MHTFFEPADPFRTTVLAQLQKITVEFVKQVGKKKGLSQSMLNEAGGKIATYGSFRLGVFGPGKLKVPQGDLKNVMSHITDLLLSRI